MPVAITSVVPSDRKGLVARLLSAISRRRSDPAVPLWPGEAAALLQTQLWTACEEAIARHACVDQIITLNCTVSGEVCAAQRDFVTEMAARLVAHAVRWGMTLHLIGRVSVAVTMRGGRVALAVTDDFWGGRSGRACRREMGAIIAAAGAAVVTEDVDWSETVTTVSLPAVSKSNV